MFAPFGSPEEDRSARWHPEPQFRGTFGILSSCLITISLCVWTALHLNIPEYDKHKKKVWPSRTSWRKTGWLILGLFAPEMVCPFISYVHSHVADYTGGMDGVTSNIKKLARSMLLCLKHLISNSRPRGLHDWGPNCSKEVVTGILQSGFHPTWRLRYDKSMN
jgi:hypothetical protein